MVRKRIYPMKYINDINSIAVYAIFIFSVKMMFFDDFINLGVIDQHYGVVYFILLLVLISCRIINKRKSGNKETDI